jgi:ABC-type transport system involved in multi-copper enzyme maturation permease subunit
VNTTAGDLPEWLSPILVKELRQGLRTGVFVSAWVIMQVLAVAAVVFEAGQIANGGRQITYDGTFWTSIGIVMWILLPFSAASAMNGERGEGRVELLVLSGAREKKVCMGKWLTGVMLGALVYLSLLPYLVARYFIAKVEPVELLIGSGVVLVGNAVATAIFIGSASCKQTWLRGWMMCLQIGSALISFGIAGASAAGVSAILFKSSFSPTGVGLISSLFVLTAAACQISLSLSYATEKIKLRFRPYEEGTFNGAAIGLFAVPFFLGLLSAATAGFGLPFLASLIAYMVWSERQT